MAIELAGEHRLGVAAQPLFGLPAHRLQKHFGLFEPIPQVDGAVEGIALVEAFYLFQALPQGQTNQQDDHGEQEPGQACEKAVVRHFGHRQSVGLRRKLSLVYAMWRENKRRDLKQSELIPLLLRFVTFIHSHGIVWG